MSRPNAADRIAFKDSLSEGREVVHLAAEPLGNTQQCGACDAVLVDNRAAEALAPYYRAGIGVVAYSGTTWATARKASCRDR